MNSSFVAEQARHLMERADISNLQRPEQRIRFLYRLLYGRDATPQEVALGLHFVEAAEGHDPEPEGPQNEKQLTTWERYGQALLLANEFVFVD
jgi:hypothetical protein